jgi:hypothetical protein
MSYKSPGNKSLSSCPLFATRGKLPVVFNDKKISLQK